jgi:signal transduction histidine kinase
VNAGKHSGTDKTHLHVRVSSSRVNVLVKDRGIGFDPDSAGSDHRSLGESILRRLEDHGGRVEIRTAPGAGTEIEMEMEMRHDLHRE